MSKPTVFEGKTKKFLFIEPSENSSIILAQTPDQTVIRTGTKDSPKLNHIRPRDIDVEGLSGQENVIANGKGISLLNLEGLIKKGLQGWLWLLLPNTSIPDQLGILPDVKDPNHFFIVPREGMLLAQYKEHLHSIQQESCFPLHVKIDESYRIEHIFRKLINSKITEYQDLLNQFHKIVSDNFNKAQRQNNTVLENSLELILKDLNLS